MNALMPPEMVAEINQAKGAMGGDQAKLGGKETIEGGILPVLGYVSWVDELIWHSTPSLKNRPYYNDMKDYIEKHWKEADNIHVYEGAIMLVTTDGTNMKRLWELNKDKLNLRRGGGISPGEMIVDLRQQKTQGLVQHGCLKSPCRPCEALGERPR